MKKNLHKISLLVISTCFAITTWGAEYYWVAGSGNWSNLNNWRIGTPSGTIPGVVPSASDNVHFGSFSAFTTSSRTVRMDVVANCSNFSISGATIAPIITGTSPLNIYGSVLLQTGTTYTVNTTYLRTSTPATFTSNGVVFGTTFIEGTQSMSLSDDYTGNTITFTQGILNTMGHSFTVTGFADAGSASKVLNLASSHVYITSNSQNFTYTQNSSVLNAGTSHIHFLGILTGSNGLNVRSGLTFYDVTFENPASTNARIYSTTTAGLSFHNVEFKGSGTIFQSNTFNRLTVAPGKVLVVNAGQTQTITEALSIATAACQGWSALQSSVEGSIATVSVPASASVNVSGAILQDIRATGGAGFIANNSVDNGNNTGWTFGASSGTNLYWVNGAGNWNDRSHWSFTSGGAGGDCVPGPFDNVFFDAGSGFTAGNLIVTVDAVSYCQDITVNGTGVAPTIRSTVAGNTLNIFGSAEWQTGMTYTVMNTVFKPRGATTIQSNNVTTTSAINLTGDGSLSLSDHFVSDRAFTHYKGTLNTNGHNFTLLSYTSSGSDSKAINLSSSQVYITTSSGHFNTSANVVLNAGTSHIRFTAALTGSWGIYAKNGDVFYDVTFENPASTSAQITTPALSTSLSFHDVEYRGSGVLNRNNTINKLTVAPSRSLTIQSGTTQFISVLEVLTPTCGGWGILQASTEGTFATINMNVSATVNVTGALLQDIRAIGGASFIANNSLDNGNNTGWTFPSSTGLTLYWVNGAGDWNDRAHWSFTSGGAGGDCVPGPQDNVFFDGGSGFTPASRTVNISATAFCRNITVNGASTAPVITSPSNAFPLNIYGSAVLQSGMTFSVVTVNFRPEGSETLTSNGVEFSSSLGNLYKLGTGSLTLADDFIGNTRTIYVSSGTFNTAGHSVTVRGFEDLGSQPKTINLGSSNVYIVASTTRFKVSEPSTIFNAGTSHIYFTAALSSSYGITAKNGTVFHDVTFEHPNGNGRIYNVSATTVYFRNVEIRGSATIGVSAVYNQLLLTAGKTYTFAASSNQVINSNLYASGNPCYILYLRSSSATRANICVNGGATTFDYTDVSGINASCAALNFKSHSTNSGNNNNLTFEPYSPGRIVGLGADTSFYCFNYPQELSTAQFYGNPNTIYTWNDLSNDTLKTIHAPGLYTVIANYGNNCEVEDTIIIANRTLPLFLVPATHEVSNTDYCLGANSYRYYRGNAATTSQERGMIAVYPNGNVVNPANVTVNNQGTLTGGGAVFSNTGSGYYQSTDGYNTTRLSKRIFSIDASGSHELNGGVVVRVYYTDADTAAMISDPLPAGTFPVFSGWVQLPANTATQAVNDLTPADYAIAPLTPRAWGYEDGLRYVEFQTTSLTSFAYVVTSNLIILPAHTISFAINQINCSEISAQWKTSHESSLASFSVQHSVDGRNYTTVKSVPAKNTTTGAEYIIGLPAVSGKSFYRLQSTERDGKIVFHETVVFQNNCTNTIIRLYPNPTRNWITITGVNNGERVKVYSIDGKLLVSNQLVSGVSKIDMKSYAPGLYVVQILGRFGEVTETLKLIKE